jgi:hypothetical protein
LGNLCPLIDEENFAGLYKTLAQGIIPNEYRYLTAVEKDEQGHTFYLSINPRSDTDPAPSTIKWFKYGTPSPIDVYHTELYIWMGPKQSSHFT